jgi:hypothetical protein
MFDTTKAFVATALQKAISSCMRYLLEYLGRDIVVLLAFAQFFKHMHRNSAAGNSLS